MSSPRSRHRWQVQIGCILMFGLLVSCGSDDTTGPAAVPADIVITPNHPAIGQGFDVQLTAKVVDATGHEIAGKVATFTSDDTLLATVTAGGLVHSVGPIGSAHIIAGFEGITNSIDVTVNQRIVGLSVLPESITVNRYLGAQLQVSAVDYLGQPAGGGGTVTYTSGNTAVVTVDALGAVTAKGVNGRTSITVVADTYHVTVPVVVKQIPALLTVAPANLLLAPGAAGQLTPHVIDQHGDPITPAPVTYHSSNPAIFTVSVTGHVLSVAGDGSGTIQVTADTLESDVGVFVGNTSPGVLVQTTPLASGAYEANVGLNGRMVVSGGGGNNLVSGALPAYTFGSPVSVGGTAFGIVLNHASTKAYVAAEAGVGVFDVASSTIESELIGFGGGTRFSVVVSNDDHHLYVGTNNGVYSIDLISGMPDDSVIIPGPTIFLAIDTVNQRLYASEDGVGVQEITLGASMALGRTFAVGSPRGVAVAPDGTELYVTSEYGGDLEVWSLGSGLRTQVVSLGGVTGFGLAASAGRIAVTNGPGTVKLFDRASRILLSTVTVTGTPARPAWNAAGTTLVVPNEAGWVDFIQ